MAGSRLTFVLLSVVAACVGNPVYDHQPFVGYHYPHRTTVCSSQKQPPLYDRPVLVCTQLAPVDASHGYFYGPPAADFGFYSASAPAPAYPFNQLSRSAVCTLTNTSTSTVLGEVRLFQGTPDEPVVVSGLVGGLSPGLHGFHVHRDGKLGNDCKDAGPHFNPDNATHAGPLDVMRHAGDLGNIEAGPTGHAEFALVSERLSLVPDSKYYAVGRAVVVHEKQDDLGKGGNEESLRTGNAGSRLACCIIRPLHF